MIILAVKPWLLEPVLTDLAPAIDFSYQMIVSLASGITLSEMKRMLSPFNSDPVLFRVIPNTAISIGTSMTFISASGASDEETDDISGLFSTLGMVDE